MTIDEHCWTLDKPMASLSTCYLGRWLGWQILLNTIAFFIDRKYVTYTEIHSYNGGTSRRLMIFSTAHQVFISL